MNLFSGIRGPAVRRLQEILDSLGFDAGPNDGVFGPSTRRIVKDLQQSVGLCQDGIVGPKTWAKLKHMLEGTDMLYPITHNGMHDISGAHEPPKNFAYLRNWQNIKGVTLHQTGCNMPKNPLGWAKVNAHYGITREGDAILINRPEDMIWHAQGASKTTIGVEIEGNYEGISGRRSTLWEPGGGPHYVNDAILSAAEIVFDDILRRFSAAGQSWRVLYGHRQASRNRRADPGEEIWRRIANAWGAYLNLSSYLPVKTFGKGRPIPKQWDSRGRGSY